MKKIILSVAILAVLFTGCKKKDDDPTPVTTKTKAELLTAHTWKQTGSVSNVAIDADEDASTPDTKDLWTEKYDECEKDDTYTFKADGTGSFTDAGTVCENDESYDFTWKLINNNTEVEMIVQGYTLTVGLVSVDDNTLKVSLPEQADVNEVVYTETITLTK
jgi:hypothetical protein